MHLYFKWKRFSRCRSKRCRQRWHACSRQREKVNENHIVYFKVSLSMHNNRTKNKPCLFHFFPMSNKINRKWKATWETARSIAKQLNDNKTTKFDLDLVKKQKKSTARNIYPNASPFYMKNHWFIYYYVFGFFFHSTATFATRININHDAAQERAFFRHVIEMRIQMPQCHCFFHTAPIQFP